jgi:hypothetical protein
MTPEDRARKRVQALDAVEDLTLGRLIGCSSPATASKTLCLQLEVLERIDRLRRSTPHDGRL